ncbi:hypothetical protein SAMN05192563_104537 [Paraburkholderia aspalathi]|uniref:Uncharacterized protein n=1 Tax=Paraburkholderia aspalathi TaxID=1324617 RepID=A0A1I7EQ17_9BURK|nr:hypothetical protein SAMN05192563_104537 [Paraburkholderia aspalathi]
MAIWPGGFRPFHYAARKAPPGKPSSRPGCSDGKVATGNADGCPRPMVRPAQSSAFRPKKSFQASGVGVTAPVFAAADVLIPIIWEIHLRTDCYVLD